MHVREPHSLAREPIDAALGEFETRLRLVPDAYMQERSDDVDDLPAVTERVLRRAGFADIDCFWRETNTAIIGGFLISALGGSRVQIGGPAGAFIVVIYAIVEKYGLANLLIATTCAGVLLFAESMEEVGDNYSIAGFCSKYRDNVTYYTIKNFGQPLSEDVRGQIGGMSGRLATAEANARDFDQTLAAIAGQVDAYGHLVGDVVLEAGTGRVRFVNVLPDPQGACVP